MAMLWVTIMTTTQGNSTSWLLNMLLLILEEQHTMSWYIKVEKTLILLGISTQTMLVARIYANQQKEIFS